MVQLAVDGSLCEVGCGPGVLLRLLRARFPDATLCGADPSSVMVRQASRAAASGPETKPLDLRLAGAEALPFDDDTFDAAVAVNNVIFWPDRPAGLREISRVTRSGGTVFVAWHGGSKPSWIQRRLVLPDDGLAGIAAAMTAHIGPVQRRQLRHSELFTARVGRG